MEMSRCVFLCVFDTALIPMLRFNGDIELTVGLIVENSVRNFFLVPERRLSIHSGYGKCYVVCALTVHLICSDFPNEMRNWIIFFYLCVQEFFIPPAADIITKKMRTE